MDVTARTIALTARPTGFERASTTANRHPAHGTCRLGEASISDDQRDDERLFVTSFRRHELAVRMATTRTERAGGPPAPLARTPFRGCPPGRRRRGRLRPPRKEFRVLLGPTGQPAWPTERGPLHQRYSDAPPATLAVPVLPAFVCGQDRRLARPARPARPVRPVGPGCARRTQCRRCGSVRPARPRRPRAASVDVRRPDRRRRLDDADRWTDPHRRRAGRGARRRSRSMGIGRHRRRAPMTGRDGGSHAFSSTSADAADRCDDAPVRQPSTAAAKTSAVLLACSRSTCA